MFPRSTDWNFSYLFKHTIRLPPQKKALKGSLTQCSPLEGSPSPFPDNYLITSIPDVGSLQSAGGCQGPYSMGLLLPSLLPCILLPLQLPPLLFTLLLTHMLPSPTLNVNFMPLKRIFVSCETWSKFHKNQTCKLLAHQNEEMHTVHLQIAELEEVVAGCSFIWYVKSFQHPSLVLTSHVLVVFYLSYEVLLSHGVQPLFNTMVNYFFVIGTVWMFFHLPPSLLLSMLSNSSLLLFLSLSVLFIFVFLVFLIV